MRKLLLLWVSALSAYDLNLEELIDRDLVLFSKQIVFPNFPYAFNPSIMEYGDGYLMVFRDCPEPFWDPWVNHLVAVFLDQNYDPISIPVNLETGLTTPCIKSQAQDPRVFTFQNRFYLIYNDNVEISRPWYRDRRDMYLAELKINNGRFEMVHPIKLVHQQKYNSILWQKNWNPFIYDDRLLLTYTISPHEVIYPNLDDGTCFPCYETETPHHWPFGILRGSSPSQLIDGEYLSFFHSGHQMSSSLSPDSPMWHYFMGAYTFSAEPPFEVKKISKDPIVGPGFYPPSYHLKKVIYPGGFVVKGDRIIISYGKDDEEMWIAELSKTALMNSLIPVGDSKCDR